MRYDFDTITAIATPVGTGGVGVIRVSGVKSLEVVQGVFSKKIKENSFTYGWIKENDEIIDKIFIRPIAEIL